MWNRHFLFELFSSVLLLRDTCTGVAETLLCAALEGREAKGGQDTDKNASYLPDRDGDADANPYDLFEENSVAVIPISGMMLKYPYWYNNVSCDDLAEHIRLAERSPRIAGTLLLMDTPGGTTTSVIPLEDALRNRTKPAVALIDGHCCSGGIYVATFCDELYAMNRMCEVGSIGVYTQIIDRREADKKWGYRIEYIYPPESKYKNLRVREALKGKPERLIREELTPYAIHFQNILKENRPKLDTSVEGVLEGRVFYAYEAIENGLIDGLMNMEQAVARVRRLALDRQTFYSQFK
jgi:protease-4